MKGTSKRKSTVEEVIGGVKGKVTGRHDAGKEERVQEPKFGVTWGVGKKREGGRGSKIF